MKIGVRNLKLPKPRVPKKTTTIRFGWTCDNDLWTSGENAPDESERGGDKTPEAWILEVNIDRPMEKDACRLICNSERNYSGRKREGKPSKS
jgi:hypothetical protein